MVHPYVMGDGTPGFFVGRFDISDGGSKYQTWHHGPDGRKRAGRGPRDPLLYNLPAVLEAVRSGVSVYLCAGEKDADAITACGLVATTNAFGEGSFPKGAAGLLAGAHVIVVLDRDEAGRRRGSRLADALRGTVASLRFVVPAGGKDAYDHLVTFGFDIDDFIETLPVTVATAAGSPPQRREGSRTANNRGGGQALADTIRHDRLTAIRNAPRGDRNNTTFKHACYLDKVANGGQLSWQAVQADIEQAALDAGLKPLEIGAILKSAAATTRNESLSFADRWHDNTTDPEVLRIEAEIDRTRWQGKHGHYCRRILLSVIEVLRQHHYSLLGFPASHAEIAKQAHTNTSKSLRRALKTLQDDGWLTPTRKGDRNGHCTRWALTVPSAGHDRLTITDSTDTHSFPDSCCGSYSRIRISNPAFLPSSWGFSSHRIMRAMTTTTAMRPAEIAARSGLARSTVCRSLARLEEHGIAIETLAGWVLADVDALQAATDAAEETGALERSEFIRARLAAKQAAFREFVAWRKTPAKLRPPPEERTSMRLVLQAA